MEYKMRYFRHEKQVRCNGLKYNKYFKNWSIHNENQLQQSKASLAITEAAQTPTKYSEKGKRSFKKEKWGHFLLELK